MKKAVLVDARKRMCVWKQRRRAEKGREGTIERRRGKQLLAGYDKIYSNGRVSVDASVAFLSGSGGRWRGRLRKGLERPVRAAASSQPRPPATAWDSLTSGFKVRLHR